MRGAGNETRTRDLNLGKVALYQLSYSRINVFIVDTFDSAKSIAKERRALVRARGFTQCGRVSVGMGTAGTSVAATAATTAGSSSDSACGNLSKATSSTRSIQRTGTISR